MRKFIALSILLLSLSSIKAQDDIVLEEVGLYGGTLPSSIKYSADFGDYLYVVGSGKIYVYHLDDPENPTLVKTINHSNVRKCWAGGNSILAVYDGEYLSLYDLSDPGNPVKKSDFSLGEDLTQVEIFGNYIYYLHMYEYTYDKKGLFGILDASDLSSPNQTDTYTAGDIEGHAFCFSEDRSKVYTAHYNYGMNKTVINELDISNPADIQVLKTVTTDKMTFKMELMDSHLILLQSGSWSPPSYLKAIEIVEGGDWIDYGIVQVSDSRPQDMNIENNSITVTLWEGGIKDYSFDTTTNIFTEGQSLTFDRASHMSMWMTETDTGPSIVKGDKTTGTFRWLLIIIFIMNNNAPATGYDSDFDGNKLFIIRKWIRINILQEVFLSMSISPLEAEEHCSVTPGVGTHTYTKDENVDIKAEDDPEAGWIFKEWTGSVGGTGKEVNVLMNEDKTAVANFKELKLVVAGSKTETTCACDVNDTEYNMVTLSATAYGDNWIMTGINLDASLNGHDVNELSKVSVKAGGGELWSANSYPADNGSLTATFDQPITIAEGQTRTFTINYTFDLPEEELITKTEGIKFRVRGNAIAKPENYDSGPVVGSATGNKYLGMVYNTAKDVFMKINDAISAVSTSSGSEVILCPGIFKEDVIIDKSITLKSERGNDVTTIEQKSEDLSSLGGIYVKADNVTIKDLMVRNCSVGIFADKQNNLTIDNCRIIYNRQNGIRIHNINGGAISNSLFVQTSGKSYGAMYIEAVKDFHINNNTITNNYNGINVWGKVVNTQVYSNQINICETGIKLQEVEGAYVTNNTLENIKMCGITLPDSKNCKVSGNTIRSIVNGVPTGMQINGMGNGIILENNKSYNCLHGVEVNEASSFVLRKNKLYYSDYGYNIDKSSNFILESNYARYGHWGMQLSNCDKFKLVSNRLFDFDKRIYRHMGYGIYFNDGNSNGYVSGNQLIRNCTGIEFDGDNNNIQLYFNNISDCFCVLTGVNMDGAEDIDIVGNSFSGNNGAAIYSRASTGITVSSNNFTDNDIGIINEENSEQINADNNFWGGSGPNQSDLQGEVVINSWLETPSNLFAAFIDPIEYVTSGQTDTLLLVVNNINDLSDEFEVTLSDENGWLTSELTQTGLMTDSTGVVFKVPFTVPSNAGTSNNVYASVISTKTNELMAKDTTLLLTYAQTLQSIALSPDSVTIMQGEDYKFVYMALDDKGNIMEIEPVWSADVANISIDGVLETEGIVGEVTVSITDTTSGISNSVVCYVTTESEVLTDVLLNKSEVTLKVGEKFQFEASSYNQFGFKMDFVEVWNSTAGVITSKGLFIADSEAVTCTITVSDTNNTVLASATVIVEDIVDVEQEIEIPTEYTLMQNYPNPFNPTTTIKFAIPSISANGNGQSVKTTLKVYDILGREVATLVSQKLHPGNHEVSFDASNLASGVYFYRIDVANKFNYVRKMILIK